MNQKLEKIFTERINKFENYVYNKILLNPIEFDVYYHKSQDPILFENRLDVNYSPILKGDKWGEAWENAWFHLKGEIPKSWSGLNVAAKLNFTGEGLIFGNDGIPRQGLTSCSVYNKEFKRDLFPIVESSVGGEKIELWIEVVASGYLGINLPLDSEENETKYHGEFNSTVNDISYAIFNEEIWQFWLDLKVLNELLHTLPPNSVRRSRIIYNINSAIDAFGDDVANVGTAREILKESFNIPAANSDLSVLAVGHAHMDTAWLWPVDETKRKIGRSFANQIALLEKYPEYVFGASQPQHYVFAKQHYPGLFDKMKKFIDEGRWELQGGMWVEADNNLVSGESIIRQIIYGKNYLRMNLILKLKIYGYRMCLVILQYCLKF